MVLAFAVPAFLITVPVASMRFGGGSSGGAGSSGTAATPPTCETAAETAGPPLLTGSSCPVKVKITIDGQDEDVVAPISCATSGGALRIFVENSNFPTKIILTDNDPPQLNLVQLKPSDGGATLGFSTTSPLNATDYATVTKNGNSYKITGTASPVSAYPPGPGGSRQFED